ncbi:MAG: energy-coupled thiamine transporter ThiT [Candidatus Bathyarchaeota archaeon]|nr:MAG: energy-coupled thiamine transporter ThiT [Candidatus Bathyarchaeota archaeon]
MKKTMVSTKILTEAVDVIALTFVLKDLLPPIFQLPQGGSITVAGMVPLLWFALRRGLGWGTLAGILYGLVHIAMGGYVVGPVQALLDYPLAFGAIGVAGLFRKYPLAGVASGVVGRFLFHLVSGVTFFWMYAPEGLDPVIYSALYNGGYLLGEFLISAIAIDIIVRRRLLDLYL